MGSLPRMARRYFWYGAGGVALVLVFRLVRWAFGLDP
jgi:hypothetical protein